MYTIGADPEVMVKIGGVMASAWGLIPGTKEEPLPVVSGAVQVDGSALEFNIDPVTSEDEFVHNIDTVLSQLSAMVPEYELAFDEPIYHLQGDEDPESLIIGCDPDYNAYDRGLNNHQSGSYRAAGGHIHLGWEGCKDFDTLVELTQLLDLRVGVPLAMKRTTLRNRSYGRLGNFRPKPYGLEYRSPDNLWVGSEELQRWIFTTCQQALIDFFEQGVRVSEDEKFTLSELSEEFNPEIVEAYL